jgi:hypothetical protein
MKFLKVLIHDGTSETYRAKYQSEKIQHLVFLSSILWQKDFNLRGKKFFDAGKF